MLAVQWDLVQYIADRVHLYTRVIVHVHIQEEKYHTGVVHNSLVSQYHEHVKFVYLHLTAAVVAALLHTADVVEMAVAAVAVAAAMG